MLPQLHCACIHSPLCLIPSPSNLWGMGLWSPGEWLKCAFCFGRSGQGLKFCISNKRPNHQDAPDPNHTWSSKAASLIVCLILSFLKSKVSINTHTAHLHIHSANLTLSSSRSAVSAAIAAGYTFAQRSLHHCIRRGRTCWPARLLKDGCLLFRAEWAELVICFVSLCVCRDILIDVNKCLSSCWMPFDMFWHEINAKTSPACLLRLL